MLRPAEPVFGIQNHPTHFVNTSLLNCNTASSLKLITMTNRVLIDALVASTLSLLSDRTEDLFSSESLLLFLVGEDENSGSV
jgi:hypothetical protein